MNTPPAFVLALQSISPALTAAAWILTAGGPAAPVRATPQAMQQRSPQQILLTGNAAAIQEGNSLFRGNCSPCHGLNAHGGGRGPDLTSGRWTHGSSDAEIFRTITQGVPGTQMPANGFEDSETWAIIAYLRTLTPGTQEVPGHSRRRRQGRKNLHQHRLPAPPATWSKATAVFSAPISPASARRARIEYLIESIREPDKELSDGMLDPNNHYGLPLVYDTVTVTLKNGDKVVGVAKNEDTFSVQLLDTSQKLHLFLKRDVREVDARTQVADARVFGAADSRRSVAGFAGLPGKSAR